MTTTTQRSSSSHTASVSFGSKFNKYGARADFAGNRVTHYFCRFMEKTAGREWMSKYVDNWLAIGPLWLGAPKLLRAMITGDRMGLEAFLFPHEGILLGRSIGSGPWMFPYRTDDHDFKEYCNITDEGVATPIHAGRMLEKGTSHPATLAREH